MSQLFSYELKVSRGDGGDALSSVSVSRSDAAAAPWGVGDAGDGGIVVRGVANPDDPKVLVSMAAAVGEATGRRLRLSATDVRAFNNAVLSARSRAKADAAAAKEGDE